MGENAKQVYKLYAMPLSEESLRAVERERFARASARYALIYTDGSAPDNCVEIDSAEMGRLTQTDKEWLTESNMLIFAEHAAKNEATLATTMDEKLDQLESALKAEKEKTKEG